MTDPRPRLGRTRTPPSPRTAATSWPSSGRWPARPRSSTASHRGVLAVPGATTGLSWLHLLLTQHVSELPDGAGTEALVLDRERAGAAPRRRRARRRHGVARHRARRRGELLAYLEEDGLLVEGRAARRQRRARRAERRRPADPRRARGGGRCRAGVAVPVRRAAGRRLRPPDALARPDAADLLVPAGRKAAWLEPADRRRSAPGRDDGVRGAAGGGAAAAAGTSTPTTGRSRTRSAGSGRRCTCRRAATAARRRSRGWRTWVGHRAGSVLRPPRRRRRGAAGAGDPVLRDGRAVGRVGTVVQHHELGPVALALVKRSVPVDAELVGGLDDRRRRRPDRPRVGATGRRARPARPRGAAAGRPARLRPRPLQRRHLRLVCNALGPELAHALVARLRPGLVPRRRTRRARRASRDLVRRVGRRAAPRRRRARRCRRSPAPPPTPGRTGQPGSGLGEDVRGLGVAQSVADDPFGLRRPGPGTPHRHPPPHPARPVEAEPPLLRVDEREPRQRNGPARRHDVAAPSSQLGHRRLGLPPGDRLGYRQRAGPQHGRLLRRGTPGRPPPPAPGCRADRPAARPSRRPARAPRSSSRTAAAAVASSPGSSRAASWARRQISRSWVPARSGVSGPRARAARTRAPEEPSKARMGSYTRR